MQRDRSAMASAAAGISIVGAGVAVSDLLTDYPVLAAQAIRYALGGAALYLFTRATRRRELRLRATDWARLAAMALTGMALFNVAVVHAVSSGEPAVVGTVVGLAPVGVAVMAPVLERRRPDTTIVAGASLAAAGAAIVQGFGEADMPALAWSVVALGCEVAFTILAVPLLRVLTPIGLTIRACVLAAAVLAVGAILDDGANSGIIRPDGRELVAIGYLAVGSTAAAFVLWYRALAHLGAERTGLFAGLMPVSAALVGHVVTPASLQLATIAGTILTASGLTVGVRRRRPIRQTHIELRGEVGPVGIEPTTDGL